MYSDKDIVFTDAAKEQLKKLDQLIDSRVREELIDRKNVPGEKVIEITASDIEEVINNFELSFRNRRKQQLIHRDLLLRFYLFMGILCTIAGIFYPYFYRILDNPIQFALFFSGIMMTFFSYFLRYYTSKADLLRSVEFSIRKQEDVERSRHSSSFTERPDPLK